MKKCIVTVYYLIDNFCKIYQEWERKKLIPSSNQRNRDGKLSLAELLTITIYFYLSPCKDFKNYYLYYLRYKYKEYFCLPSYSRIIQLLPRMLLPLAVLMHYLKGDETGIYYIDSTKLAICHNKRTSSNRVFNRFSKIGKSSYGWFLGFKLHLIINNKGEIMSVKITKGNKSDLSIASVISEGLSGKLFGDKAYISKELFHQLFSNGLRLFTNLRKDMKTYLLDIDDKCLLNKRSLIESVFNVLKKHMHLEHTRHRSPLNFFVHIIASLTSYSISKLNPYLISSSFSSNSLS
ncbi:transposase DDE domain protein [Orientia tsutsugamushi str. UT76]|uniref:Transposase n=2 Tax=Orientia tsutsugamushi TaxID=784 RepID=A0A2U3R2B4_ORITS|nr:IS982 family transposase [Orientia tsutsugamushi]KJV75911.1 transposase DDE domain protein [Orientia tsutsugamushi str. UT76]KJV74113.1 transposase DDE domain protein [Orientia tsutsugamushi str. TA716]KJV77960.1 transposase DDE domain protein [Orientia tsutsugamushi str. UT76]KJV88013.1 transposase DDE domain protein [Orientia tsutsugamushi str. UT76]KJV88848.1 transposase DDE domain protein [Orientia tsutsugamushi str. UT76]